ncbi:MAG: ATP-binding protein [Prevotella sp.]|nr:ATP-binding protein [Prevotella sp.]
MHLVTFANLIQLLFDRGYKVYFHQGSNQRVFNYIYNELKFSEYWSKGKNHVDVKISDNIFNLWRIVDPEKDFYAKNVENYLKRNYFEGKDLSTISTIMLEAFYNVFDHANANNNAFSLIQYDAKKKILYAAISDFGVGIVQSVRILDNTLHNDREALEQAIRDNFTVHSTDRNRGFGLSNILNGSDCARIFSGNGLVVKVGEQLRTFEARFAFPGTLIYFEVNLANSEDEEIINEFDW